MTAVVDCLLTLWMDCCFCMDSSRNTNHSALIVTVCYTCAPRMLLLQYCDAEILLTTLKKLTETVGANSIIAIIKDISFYHPIYAETGGDRNRSVWGRVGMDPSTCGSGWGWIQTTRGQVGMGLKSCPRADLYLLCLLLLCIIPSVFWHFALYLVMSETEHDTWHDVLCV